MRAKYFVQSILVDVITLIISGEGFLII